MIANIEAMSCESSMIDECMVSCIFGLIHICDVVACDVEFDIASMQWGLATKKM